MDLADHLQRQVRGDHFTDAPQLDSTCTNLMNIEQALARQLCETIASPSKRRLIEEAIATKGLQASADLDRVFGPAFHAFGFDYFHAVQIERSDAELVVSVNCGTRNIRWENHYTLRSYREFDPIISEIMRSHEACFWSEIAEKRGRLTPAERLVLEDAAKFGLSEGYFLPLYSSNEKITAAVLAGRDIDPHCMETRLAAKILASAYLGKVGLLRPARPATTGRARLALRSRQAECLRWVAAGKTSAEIAIVLGLSRKTVDEHVENACKSFGVNGRMQAVVRAIQMGLIPPT